MKLSAREIAEHLKGDIIGNPDVQVSSPARIEYGKAGNICFLANLKYEKYLYTTNASIVLINRTFTPREPVKATLIAVDDAYQAVADLLDYFSSLKRSRKKGGWLANCLRFNTIKGRVGRGTYIGEFTVVERKARIGRDCQIYPQVFIGENVKIGNNVTIYQGVKIYRDCVIGDNCILHAGCVIGADGFGFAPREDGSYKKIQQTGNVVIEDDVEIGANSCVDRAMMGTTIVRKNTKIDNLVQIGHNCEVGESSFLCAQVGIAGSTKVGSHCIMAGQVGVAGHITIPDNTILGAQSGVAGTIRKPGMYMGSPAIDAAVWRRASVGFKNLPEMWAKLNELTKK